MTNPARYLNKIVFINSAYMKHEEVQLAGNIHFVGTQGVGKTSVLRAIVFAYTADPDKLGLKQGQQKFIEFYLPRKDSYIIYEVMRENGPFCIIAFRYQTHVAWRFIATAYRRSIFMDENGNVFTDWGKIFENTRGAARSELIQTQIKYRDILSGTLQKGDTKNRGFSLMESPSYKDISNIIQNIFLNKSLDARTIKDTIINSVFERPSDKEADLNYWRKESEGFRQRYEDISKWYRKGKADADVVFSRHTEFEASHYQVITAAGELLYALQRDKQRIPQMEEQLSANNRELDNQNRLSAEEDEKYQDMRDGLIGDKTKCEISLEKANERRSHYETIKINDILARIEQKEALEIQRDSIEQQIKVCTAQNEDVTAKYDQLQKLEEDQLRQYVMNAEHQRGDCQIAYSGKVLTLQQQFSEKEKTVQADYMKSREEWDIQNALFVKKREELKIQEAKITAMNPNQQEMDEVSRRIEEAKEQHSTKQLRSESLAREIQKIRTEAELTIQQQESIYTQKEKELSRDIKDIQKDIDKLTKLYERQKGSLIEWLSSNVEGWEDTFGKVLDEEDVLYNDRLSPHFAEKSSNNVFGVTLSVENIERKVRTPQDILSEKLKKEELLSQKGKEKNALHTKLDEDKATASDKASDKIRPLRNEQKEIQGQLSFLSQNIDRHEKILAQKAADLRIWREEETGIIQNQLANVEQEIDRHHQKKLCLDAQYKQALEDLTRERSKGEEELSQQLKAQEQAIDADLCQKRAGIEARKKALQEQMDAQLRGEGVDTEHLNALRLEHKKCEEELSYIAQHQTDKRDWERDTEEYFSHEAEWKDKLQSLLRQLTDNENQHKQRSRKYQELVAELTDVKTRLQQEIAQIQKCVDEVEQYVRTETFKEEFGTVSPIETSISLSVQRNVLSDALTQKDAKWDKLREAVTAFKANFSVNNTLGLHLECNTEAEYFSLVEELASFIEKGTIAQLHERMNSQYSLFLKRVSRKVGDLLNNRGTIKSIIDHINRDFKANNFVGAIKDIELRIRDGNDGLMLHLIDIYKFDSEHGNDIGEMNLFTTEDVNKETNEKAVELLKMLVEMLSKEPNRETVSLADTFKLEFKIRENDNDTNWVEKISNVGSDGTDVLIKAMINIMLLNVFKNKGSRKFRDFSLHCMMDEIGKLHSENVKGLIKFANDRGIWLINSSPEPLIARQFHATYQLIKDRNNCTRIQLGLDANGNK